MGNGRGENGDWEGMKWGLGGEEMGTEREGNGDWERRKWGWCWRWCWNEGS